MNIFLIFFYLFTDHPPDQHLMECSVFFVVICMFMSQSNILSILQKLTSFFLDNSALHCLKNVSDIVLYHRRTVTPPSIQCICVNLKCFSKLDEWVFHNTTQKKSSYKHKSANEWFLGWNKRLESTINTLTM
jgi:hypothetical protein